MKLSNCASGALSAQAGRYQREQDEAADEGEHRPAGAFGALVLLPKESRSTAKMQTVRSSAEGAFCTRCRRRGWSDGRWPPLPPAGCSPRSWRPAR